MISHAQNAYPQGCPYSLAPEKSLLIHCTEATCVYWSVSSAKRKCTCLFLGRKIYLPQKTRARAHTHTHTHTSPFLSLSLYHLKNQDLSLEFLVLKKSWRLLLTEKGPELSVTHTHTESHGDSQQEEHCVCFHASVTLSVHLHAHGLTFGKKRAPHPLRV